MCTMKDYDKVFASYAEYKRIEEAAKAEAEKLKAEIIELMKAEGLETLPGIEHKATYKQVITKRLDTKAVKLDLPAVYDKYAKETKSMRFNFS